MKLVFFLVATLSFGQTVYHTTPAETAALKWFFPAAFVADLEFFIVEPSTLSDPSACSIYTSGPSRIWINKNKLDRFRRGLFAVHEAMHWWQKEVCHKSFRYTQKLSEYIIVPGNKRPTIEQQADIARILAINYLGIEYSNHEYNDELLDVFPVVEFELWAQIAELGFQPH